MLSLVASVAVLMALPAKADQDHNWSGWWFVYHRDQSGEWVVDKMTVALLIDAPMARSIDERVSGQWTGCIWTPARLELTSGAARLVTEIDGHRRVATLGRPAPDQHFDEAIVTFSGDETPYRAKRQKEFGECAGHSEDGKVNSR